MFEQWAALLPGLALRGFEPRTAGSQPGGTGGEAEVVSTEVMTGTLARAGLAEALAEAFASGAVVTIVVNDGHRFTDTRSFLDALFVLVDRRALKTPFQPPRNPTQAYQTYCQGSGSQKKFPYPLGHSKLLSSATKQLTHSS